MKKRHKAKDNTDFYIVIVIAVIAVIGMFFFSDNQKAEKVAKIYEPETTSDVYESATQGKVIPDTRIEQKNVVGVAFKLNECLQDCQYKICKRNCGTDEGVDAECFRSCIDECNGKCLKVYDWN